jgi:dihydroorotase
MYDFLIKGGTVIDPARGLHQPMDVALSDDLIAAVAEDIPTADAKSVVDVQGKLVVPGLVDLHTHVFPGATQLGIDADKHCLAKGTTTILDAGSAGALNIEGFRRYVVASAKTRMRALLNISAIGIPSLSSELVELGWLPLADVKAALKAVDGNRDLVCGLKVRLSEYIVRENGIEPLHLALEVAEETGLPVMVHVGGTPVPLAEILRFMRPGDIVTHIYTAFDGIGRPFRAMGGGSSILGANGSILPEMWAGRQRGVIMDVGHGMGGFSFEVCSAAIEQGFKPDTISSDLHQGSVRGPAYDLPTVMSRFLSLGMTLPEVIAATTVKPAQVLGLANEIGTLQPGAAGDVAVLDLLNGCFEFRDATGQILWGDRKLIPFLTVKAGELVNGKCTNT